MGSSIPSGHVAPTTATHNYQSQPAADTNEDDINDFSDIFSNFAAQAKQDAVQNKTSKQLTAKEEATSHHAPRTASHATEEVEQAGHVLNDAKSEIGLSKDSLAIPVFFEEDEETGKPAVREATGDRPAHAVLDYSNRLNFRIIPSDNLTPQAQAILQRAKKEGFVNRAVADSPQRITVARAVPADRIKRFANAFKVYDCALKCLLGENMKKIDLKPTVKPEKEERVDESRTQKPQDNAPKKPVSSEAVQRDAKLVANMQKRAHQGLIQEEIASGKAKQKKTQSKEHAEALDQKADTIKQKSTQANVDTTRLERDQIDRKSGKAGG
ncbi:MAG: hypothetical protein H0X51_05280 [Parachlamydiaceae bacterium]|nr:hypothetical protein [Parachlamydiaceae bacterium]